MFPILHLGSFSIQTTGLILILGLWIGLSLAEKYASQAAVDPNQIYSIAISSLLAGVIGARLVFLARYPESFVSNPASLFSLDLNTFDTMGGLLIGALAGLIVGQRKNLHLWSTLDALTPVFSVFGITLGLAHLASGDAFGSPASLPWGIYLWGAQRHPTQIYETALAVFIAAAVWPRREKQLQLSSTGKTFLIFLGMSAAARIVVETFRGDSITMLGGLRVAQAAAWLVLAASLWLLGKRQDRETSAEAIEKKSEF